MKSLGDEVCLFFNLISIPVQWCEFWLGVVGTQLFFYWFQGRNLLIDDQNFKRGGDVKKGEGSIIKAGVFLSIKSFVTFS